VFVRCGQVPQVVVDLMLATALKGREIRYGARNGATSDLRISGGGFCPSLDLCDVGQDIRQTRVTSITFLIITAF
jgi:hypothetical protein